jgi:class 3 adenylate cyclase
MTTAPRLRPLDGFFPRRLVRRLDTTGTAPNEISLRAAVLFADISGYTRLAETLFARADEGLGELSALLNDEFGRYVASVHAHGGEIVYFAGDSFLAYWADDHAPLSSCIGEARACAEELVRPAGRRGGGGRPTLRTGIGAGRAWAAYVGGEDDCWHVVFGGRAVRHATSAAGAARPGEIAVARSAAAEPDVPESGLRPGLRHAWGPAPLDVSLTLSETPASLVPRVMVERAESDAPELGELRQVTAVFTRFTGFDEDAPDALRRMHRLASAVHRAIAPSSGSPGHWLIEDKGLIFFVVFGVPYNAHADDPQRAVRAALALQEAAWPQGIECATGVASGRAFCGPIGALSRREYVTVSRAMIVAARLMVSGGRLRYAGRPPADDGRADVVFDRAPPVEAKGLAEPIDTYFVRRRVGPPGADAAPVFGRGEEQGALAELLDRARQGQSGVVLVEGEAGIGKSCLLEDLQARARAAGVRTLLGHSHPVEYTPTLLPWREIFRSLLGVGAGVDPKAVRDALDTWLRSHEAMAPLAPLLNAVLRIDLDETEETRHVQGPARVGAIVRFMIEFLEAAAPGHRLIVLEDCHGMDSDSWRLAQAAARLPHTLVALSTRPTLHGPESSWLREHPGFRAITLRPLKDADIEQVVSHRLRAKSMGRHLVDTITRRSSGHPLMAIEYALSLLDSHRATVHDGNYTLRGGVDPLADGTPPASIQALLASRIDHLDVTEQLALKTASALGQTFSSTMLGLLAHGSWDEGVLERLVERGLLNASPEPRLFAFRHSLVREVAYGLMPVTQRRGLHGAIAVALEARDPTESALLAHHFHQAGDHERTVRHADAAALHSLQVGAYREAAYFLELCIQIGPHYERWNAPSTIARWRRQLADAYHGLGNLVARRLHAQQALAVAGYEVDPSRGAKALAVARLLSRRLWGRGGRPTQLDGTRSPPREPSVLDMAKAYRHMVELAYFDHDGLGMVWGALRAIDVAERTTPSADLSFAYAQLGGTMGLARIHPLERHFVRRAVRSAQAAGAVHAEGYAHMIDALYQVGLGKWEPAVRSAARCQELGRRTGDHVTWGYAEVVRFWTHYYRNDLAEARQSAELLRAEARRTEHQQHSVWALRCEALLDARCGSLAAAAARLEDARSLLSDTKDATELIIVHGALGLARFELHNRDAAVESAMLALHLGHRAGRPTNHATFTGIVAALHVLFELRLREPGEPAWHEAATKGIDILRRYRRVFPIVEPSYRYWRGRMLALNGARRTAAGTWRRGLASACALGMPIEQRQLREALTRPQGRRNESEERERSK